MEESTVFLLAVLAVDAELVQAFLLDHAHELRSKSRRELLTNAITYMDVIHAKRTATMAKQRKELTDFLASLPPAFTDTLPPFGKKA